MAVFRKWADSFSVHSAYTWGKIPKRMLCKYGKNLFLTPCRSFLDTRLDKKRWFFVFCCNIRKEKFTLGVHQKNGGWRGVKKSQIVYLKESGYLFLSSMFNVCWPHPFIRVFLFVPKSEKNYFFALHFFPWVLFLSLGLECEIGKKFYRKRRIPQIFIIPLTTRYFSKNRKSKSHERRELNFEREEEAPIRSTLNYKSLSC